MELKHLLHNDHRNVFLYRQHRVLRILTLSNLLGPYTL